MTGAKMPTPEKDETPRYTTRRLHAEVARARAQARMELLDELEATADGQRRFFDKKQMEFPGLEDFTDEDGVLRLPDDIAPLLSGHAANGRYSEASWWHGTIRELKQREAKCPDDVGTLLEALQPFAEALLACGDDPALDGRYSLLNAVQDGRLTITGVSIGDVRRAKELYDAHMARAARSTTDKS
jgi:hypothetical protein